MTLRLKVGSSTKLSYRGVVLRGVVPVERFELPKSKQAIYSRPPLATWVYRQTGPKSLVLPKPSVPGMAAGTKSAMLGLVRPQGLEP